MRNSFADLGRKADDAAQTIGRAGAFLRQIVERGGEDALRNSIKVQIDKANFGDGSQQLAHALNKVFHSNFDALLSEAMEMLEEDAKAARAELRAAFDADSATGPGQAAHPLSGGQTNGTTTGPDADSRPATPGNELENPGPSNPARARGARGGDRPAAHR